MENKPICSSISSSSWPWGFVSFRFLMIRFSNFFDSLEYASPAFFHSRRIVETVIFWNLNNKLTLDCQFSKCFDSCVANRTDGSTSLRFSIQISRFLLSWQLWSFRYLKNWLCDIHNRFVAYNYFTDFERLIYLSNQELGSLFQLVLHPFFVWALLYSVQSSQEPSQSLLHWEYQSIFPKEFKYRQFFGLKPWTCSSQDKTFRFCHPKA